MRRARRSSCPVNVFLEVLGDHWSLLIVRDLMFEGPCRYGELLRAKEGIATNILAARLRQLETDGVIGRRRDPADARRWVYRVTQKGIDLAPIFLELSIWSARHYRTDAPAAVMRRMTGKRKRLIAELRRQLARARALGGAADHDDRAHRHPLGSKGASSR